VIGGTVADRAIRRTRAVAPGAALAVAALSALVVGATFTVSAYSVHLLALPAAIVLCGLAVVSLSRPEIGIATAFTLLSLNSGLVGAKPWLPGAAWIGFLFVASLTAERRRTQRLPRSCTASLCFALVGILELTVTGDLRSAIPVLRSVITGVALMLVIVAQVRDRRQAQWVLGGMVAGAAFIGGYAAWEYLSGAGSSIGFITDTGALVNRVTAGFGQPNQLAGFLILLVPLAVAGALLRGRRTALYAVAAMLGVLGVYATFSRGALLSLLVVPLVFLGRRRAMLLAPLVAIALLVATPSLVRERFGTLTQQGPEVADRTDFWRTAGSVWADHPVIGVGPGGFGSAYAAARLPGKRFLPDTHLEPPPHAHNLALNLLAEEGLAGFVAFGVVFALALTDSLRLQRSTQRWVAMIGRAGFASLLAFAFHNLFDVTLLEGTGTYFWGLLGVLGALTVIDLEAQLIEPVT